MPTCKIHKTALRQQVSFLHGDCEGDALEVITHICDECINQNLDTVTYDPGDRRVSHCGACSKVYQDSDGNNIRSDDTMQILGADDEWYCARCQYRYYRSIVQHYNARKEG